MNSKSVFVTRKISNNDFFSTELTKNGLNVNGTSLINIAPVRFSYCPATDWIFFSSINGVKFFLDQQPAISPNTKLAAIGPGTNKALSEAGLHVHFAGQGNDIEKTGKAFAAVVGNDSILFPQAIGSLQSIQRALSFKNKVYNLFVYKTDEQPVCIPKHDILFFTSPSNVRSYFKANTISKDQKIISIGASTTHTLKSYGMESIFSPASFEQKDFVKVVLENVN